MDFLKLIAYIFSGSACFCLAIMLLVMKLHNLPQNKDYQRIKSFLAYSALIDVLVDILVVSIIIHNQSIFVLDFFVVPVAYYFQLYLMGRAILGLLHSSKSMRMGLGIHVLPVVVIALLYLGGYLRNGASFPLLSEAGYVAYTTTLWAKSLSAVLYFFVFGGFAAFLIRLIYETRQYLGKLKNYYSGTEVIDGQRLSVIAWCFLGYFVLAGLDFLLSSDMMDSVFMIVNTFIFMIFAFFIINLQGVYLSVQQVENFEVKAVDEEKNLSELKMEENDPVHTADKNEPGIMNAINKWASRVDKPYLKRSLVVADVAESIGITGVQLSFVLNHSMNLNFNEWINKLRIEESKRMMESNPLMSVSDIANVSGFSDLNTFTRNFKKMAKMTPVSYKKDHSA